MLLPLLTVLAAAPFTLTTNATAGGTADAPIVDQLLADAAAQLEREGALRRAAPDAADVVLAPSLVPLTSGKVRLVLEVRSRVVPAMVERVGFEQSAGRFGPTGARKMLGVAVEAAGRVHERALAPPPPALSGASSPAADAPRAAEPPPPGEGRLRWGASAGVGVFTPGPMFAFGAEARFGWQLNRWLGLYVAAGGRQGLLLNVSLNGDGGGGSGTVGVASLWYVTALAELMAGDTVFLAAGPGFARGGWSSLTMGADVNGNAAQSSVIASGWMPAFDLKLGLGFGRRDPQSGRRHQFTLALDAMVVLAPNSTFVGQGAGPSGASQRVQSLGTAVGFAPMLTFGYDGR